MVRRKRNTWLIIKLTILKFHNILRVDYKKSSKLSNTSVQNYDENNQYLHEMFKEKFSEKFNFIGKTKSISVWPIYKTKNIFFGYKNYFFCLGDSSAWFYTI